MNYVNEPALSQFRNEIRQYYPLSLLNLVFAELTVALGILVMVHQFISVIMILPTITGIDFSPVMLVLAVIATFAGFRWILVSIRIFGALKRSVRS